MFALVTSLALAQDPVDVGIVRASDVRVVQKILYPKDDRSEMAAHVGWMPFDALLTTPNAAFSFTKHTSEEMGFGVWAGGGYGLKNGRFRELESPAYGVSAEAYRYLASVTAGVEWSPIYAKMTTNGTRIWHHDVFLVGRAGASLGSSVIPGGGISVAPTIAVGAGARVFVTDSSAIRIGLTDDFLLEHRNLTDKTYLKQNVNLTVGWSILSPLAGG